MYYLSDLKKKNKTKVNEKVELPCGGVHLCVCVGGLVVMCMEGWVAREGVSQKQVMIRILDSSAFMYYLM